MERVVSIDEAINMLVKLKQNGKNDVVLLSEYDIETGISIPAKHISIRKGIKIIETSENPISYIESQIMKSLSTQSIKKIETISFV